MKLLKKMGSYQGLILIVALVSVCFAVSANEGSTATFTVTNSIGKYDKVNQMDIRYTYDNGTEVTIATEKDLLGQKQIIRLVPDSGHIIKTTVFVGFELKYCQPHSGLSYHNYLFTADRYVSQVDITLDTSGVFAGPDDTSVTVNGVQKALSGNRDIQTLKATSIFGKPEDVTATFTGTDNLRSGDYARQLDIRYTYENGTEYSVVDGGDLIWHRDNGHEHQVSRIVPDSEHIIKTTVSVGILRIRQYAGGNNPIFLYCDHNYLFTASEYVSNINVLVGNSEDRDATTVTVNGVQKTLGHFEKDATFNATALFGKPEDVTATFTGTDNLRSGDYARQLDIRYTYENGTEYSVVDGGDLIWHRDNGHEHQVSRIVPDSEHIIKTTVSVGILRARQYAGVNNGRILYCYHNYLFTAREYVFNINVLVGNSEDQDATTVTVNGVQKTLGHFEKDATFNATALFGKPEDLTATFKEVTNNLGYFDEMNRLDIRYTYDNGKEYSVVNGWDLLSDVHQVSRIVPDSEHIIKTTVSVSTKNQWHARGDDLGESGRSWLYSYHDYLCTADEYVSRITITVDTSYIVGGPDDTTVTVNGVQKTISGGKDTHTITETGKFGKLE